MGLETAIIIGTVVAAASASYSGYVQKDNAIDQGKAENQAAQDQARNESQAAAEEAAKIRERSERFKAEQAASLAGSGVKIDGGSSGTLMQSTDRLAEQDTLSLMRTTSQRGDALLKAASNKADLLNGAANSAAVSSGLNFAATAASNYGSYKTATAKSDKALQMNQDTASGNFIRTKGNKYGLSLMGGSDT